MNILVVGGGGREHAIIRKLKQDSPDSNIYCAPGNAGIAKDASCMDIKATNIEGMIAAAKNISADFVIVTPDDPLVLGMVDEMEAAGFPAFGPTKAAAQIEGSKVFAKNLMKKYNIPTADFQRFTQRTEAMDYINAMGKFPVVIKADGLALGKGVIIAETAEEADDTLKGMLEDKLFGASGDAVVIEEFLTGPEVSVLALCDGETVKPMVSAMDHKRALDGNLGLNTGGMGTIAPNPHYTQDIENLCMETIFKPTLRAMSEEGTPFKGCLFFGLMLTPDGPKVIEYNCRFGDPETQVVLPLLEGNLLSAMLATRNGTLANEQIGIKAQSAACVIAASGGYPGAYKTGIEIRGLNDVGQAEDASVYHAGTKTVDGKFVTAGGRVLGITAIGSDLEDALKKAYSAAGKIGFDGKHMRTDIGKY